MNRSLERHLSRTLALTIVLLCLIASTTSFVLAYSEAKEFQDDMLRQISALNTSSTRSAIQPHGTGNQPVLSDPESLVTIIHLPQDARPAWLTDQLTPGLHTLDTHTVQLRVFIRDTQPGERTIVAQTTDVRNEIAIDSALRTLIPLLLLIPVLAWLIVRIVRRELAPITQLSKSLDEQQAERPHPLESHNLPQEIMPFVQAINRLLERINILMGQQRRFIADAAHELRSPLTALSVQAQNLQQANSLPAVHERLIPLQAGIERARQLTEQMLNLARTQSEAGETTLVNISVMARELIALYLPLADKKHIDLGMEETAPLVMRTSADTLKLIIKNALENALKYTPNHGEVTLRLSTENGNAIIEIIDNGPGIPEAEYTHVFDAFYRISQASGDGSGLGLAIAREAAARLGGTINLHARQNMSGLVFCYQQKSVSS